MRPATWITPLLATALSHATLGMIQEPLYQLRGQESSLQLGYAVTGMGDVNGDGHEDFAVGSANQAVGKVRVHSGVDGSRLYELHPDPLDKVFGSALDAAGDVDADGVPDLIVGSRGYSNWAGRALVVSGSDGSLLHEFLGSGTAALGFSVTGAGDLNADGFADLVVGAPFTSDPYLHTGAVYAYSGKDGSLIHYIPGIGMSEDLGQSVDSAGDVNGDGFDDFVVSGRGIARVFSGKDAAVLREWTGDPDSWFGYSISSVDDIDGDGTSDLIVGIPLAGASVKGKVELYSMGTGTLLSTYWGGIGDHLGVAVSSLGDMDGDGLREFAMSAGWPSVSSDYVRVRSGTNKRWIAEFHGRVTSFGRSIASAGDVNRDGLSDLIVGAPEATPSNHGRAYVYLGHLGLIGTSYCVPAAVNSTGAPAHLFASGNTKVAKNSLRLTTQHLPQFKMGLILVGDTQGFVAHPGSSQGNLCLSGTIGRFSSQLLSSGASGTFSLDVDLNSLPGFGAVQAGETWNFQAWYRDTNPGPTSNFTEAVSVMFD